MTRLSDFLREPVRNGLYKPNQFHGRGVKVVNMGELFAYPRLGDVDMRRVEANASELNRFRLETGDLLFARRSLTAEGAGATCYVNAVKEPTIFESSLIRARINRQKADPLYVYYWFRSPEGRAQVRSILRQVAVSGITGTDLANLAFNPPAINRQRAISELLGVLDEKIELNQRSAETLEAVAQALFRSWFINFDSVHAKAEGRPTGLPDNLAALFPHSFGKDGLPEGWAKGTIATLATVNPTTPLKAETAPYIDMAALPTSGPRVTRVLDRAPGSGARFRNGDTLIARITPCLENGKTALVDRLAKDAVGWGSTEFIVLRPNPGIPKALPYLLARHQPFRDMLIVAMTGTSGRQRVQVDVVTRWPLALPTTQVLEAFESVTGPVFDRITQLEDEAAALAELRDILMPKLISGELCIGDAEAQVSAA